MILRQKLDHKVHGWWDGGKRDTFDWIIQGQPRKDEKGSYVKVGAWEANYFFHVKEGKTERATLSYARKHLKATTRVPSTFEYVEE